MIKFKPEPKRRSPLQRAWSKVKFSTLPITGGFGQSRMVRFSKGVLKATTLGFLGGAFFTAYYYPELRKDPF